MLIYSKNLTKKMSVFGAFFLLIGITVIPSTSGDILENSIDQTLDNTKNNNGLDMQFIYSLTENLSNIIFTEYNESAGEIAKGRAFGTKGEHKAAQILFENMTDLGLDPKIEQITITKEHPELITKIDIKELGFTVYNKTSHELTNVPDCYISGKWNFTGISFILNDLKIKKPILGFIFEKMLKSLILPINGSFDSKFNLYDPDKLNNSFSYKGLKVIKKPTNYSLAKDLVRGIENDDPFVYIGKDYSFSEWIPESVTFEGFIYKTILNLLDPYTSLVNQGLYQEQILWTLFQPNCKGVILVDSNYDTYNMGPYTYCPLPIIIVNRTVGEEILENPSNFEIDFHLNQEFNNSVESYNVIGTLEGKNKDETIVVCSLYDSWWCQGTADSAIGMSMALAIAKYFKDNCIIPERNIKFIAFCGEEYGLRGAMHYEETYRGENVSYVLDLNQLGFTSVIPENIRFQIWTNDESVNQSMVEFIEDANYTERTGIEYATRVKVECGPSNVKPFAWSHRDGKRNCKTILFVKTGLGFEEPNWLHHHRDGINHTHGDVIDNFNWTDTEVTGELALNVTKYFTIEKEDEDPDKNLTKVAPLISKD